MLAGLPLRIYDNFGDESIEIVMMPDFDIANLGKHRLGGVAWVCGDFIEVLSTSSHFLTGIEPLKNPGIPKLPLSAEEISRRCATRAAKQVRRIVNTNRFRYMWTLTFCPENSEFAGNYENPVSIENQRDYNHCRKLWKQFSRKLSRNFGNISWLVVFELHDSEKTSPEKRGTYHLHFTTNTFLKWNDTFDMWGHGNIRYDDFEKPVSNRGGKVRNPGAYMAKYIGKAFEVNAPNRKRYTCSRNCLRPKKLTLQAAQPLLFQYTKQVYSRDRSFEFWGEKSLAGGVYGISQRTYCLPETTSLSDTSQTRQPPE